MRELKFTKALMYKLESIYAENGKTSVNAQDIAKDMGMSPSHFSQYRQEKKIPYKYLLPYCLDKHVNINWVLDSNASFALEEVFTKYVKKWTMCRSDIVGRNEGKYGKDWEGIESVLSVISEYFDTDEYRNEKVNFEYELLLNKYKLQTAILSKYRNKYKSLRLLMYKNKYRTMIWALIFFFIGILVGYLIF